MTSATRLRSSNLTLLAIACAALCISTLVSGCDDDEPDDDDIEAAEVPVARVTVPELLAVRADLVERVEAQAAGEVQDAEALGRLAEVFASVQAVLQTDLQTVLDTRDPGLAVDMYAWTSALADDLLAAVATRDAFADRLTAVAPPGGTDPDVPSGLSDAPGVSSFESRLGRLMDSVGDYMMDDGPDASSTDGDETNRETGDQWVDYLNDQTESDADPDPNDPEVDATGDDWTTYLNDDAPPGADPDLPDYEEGSDDGVTVTVNDGDTVVLWVDEDGNLDRVETQRDDDGSGDDGSGDDGSGDDESGDDGSGDGGADGDETPCEPHVDGCGADGDLPDEEPDDGTTQPGVDGEEDPVVDPGASDGGLGPLILVGPDHEQGGPVVLVVRSPTYGLTQPQVGGEPVDGGLWAGDADAIFGRLETLFREAEATASRLGQACGPPGC